MAHQPRTDPPEGPQNIIIRSEIIWPAPPAARSQEWQKKHARPLPKTPAPSGNPTIITRGLVSPCHGLCGRRRTICNWLALAGIFLPVLAMIALLIYAAVAQ